MIPALCLLSGVAAASECKYTTDVDTSFEGVISKSQNYDKKTYPYVDDTRKCVVNMDVKINGKWHPTSGTYVFGPDTSENDACKSAELSAKESILRTTVPEKLKKTMEQKCRVGMTDITGDKVEPPAPNAAPTVPVQPAPMPMPVPPLASWNPIVLPDIYPICREIWMTVWIDGREQAAWKEICQ